jgi:hypothetical protein
MDRNAGGQGRVEQHARQRAASQGDRPSAVFSGLSGIVHQCQPLAGLVEHGKAARRQPHLADLIEQAEGAQCVAAIGRQGQEQALVTQLLRQVALEHHGREAGRLQRQRGRQSANAATAYCNGG